MPLFEPFPGVRYAAADGRLDDLIAPPYDVVTPDERARLAARSPYNAVRLELPEEEGDRDRYAVAAALWQEWQADGVLRSDEEDSFYVYRMGYHDEDGRPHQATGVLGALTLSPLDEGDVLPHEHTTPKARADRLDLLRACRANLSPIWALSTTEGLSALCEPSGPPDARATDDEGVHHRLWRVSAPGAVGAITAAVGAGPVIIADGHHRYETALAYRDERRATTGGTAGAYDAVLAWVVEAVEDQLTVAPTHRLVSGLPDGFDLVGALEPFFELDDAGTADGALPQRMAAADALALVTAEGASLLRPRPETEAAAGQALDTSRLDVALAALPAHGLVYQHGLAPVLAAVSSGAAQAGFVVRPATIAQIAAVGRGGARMPPKTTFFTPKPRTGMVFRAVPG